MKHAMAQVECCWLRGSRSAAHTHEDKKDTKRPITGGYALRKGDHVTPLRFASKKPRINDTLVPSLIIISSLSQCSNKNLDVYLLQYCLRSGLLLREFFYSSTFGSKILVRATKRWLSNVKSLQ